MSVVEQTASLLDRLRGGDHEVLGELFMLHRDRLWRMLYVRLDRRVASRVTPDDVLQETFLDVASRIGGYLSAPEVPFYVWLRFLAIQRMQTAHRAHLGTRMRDVNQEVSFAEVGNAPASADSMAGQLVSHMTSPSQAAMRHELQERLRAALDEMDPVDREVLALRHFEELGNGEVAEILGISKDAASKRHIRALQRLREILVQRLGTRSVLSLDSTVRVLGAAWSEEMAELKNTSILVDELAEDFACRWRAGQRPSIDAYVNQHPELADDIRNVLGAVLLMEQFKPQREDITPIDPAPAIPHQLPERVGEFRVVREIGRGGMGVVYEAHEEALGRRVAIKVMPGHLLANDVLRSRFRREAQAAARLHHTSIVPVFGVGECDGQCWYVMQLIEGRSLDRIIHEAAARQAFQDLTPREFFQTVARIGFQVADALAYAHAQGVLHRDIKPSNLLLDARGAPWITDFGVAKMLEGTNLTQSGDLIGTLKYMPPEQFAGQSDARGDVYSLGMTLYELVTLRSAFPDTNPQHMIRLITQESPTRPRKINPEIPKDLETIVLKAVARDPAHRYQSPAELAEDLRRFQSDRPILARRTSPLGQLWRWSRRNPALSAASAAALLLLLTVAVVSLAAYAQTAAANRDMEKALAAETIQRDRAEATAALALDALNRTYDRFAPTRLVVVPPTSGEIGIDLPPRPPAMQPEAVALLEDLLHTYEQIAQSGSEFPKLRDHVAEANHRMGDIRRRLGRYEPAAIAYRTAIDLYKKSLAEADPDAVRVKLARAENELGRTLRSLQKVDEAKRMHESAIATLADAPKSFGDRPECRYELACSYYALGERDMFVKDGPKKQDWPGPPPGKGKQPTGPPWGKGEGEGDKKIGPGQFPGKGPPPRSMNDQFVGRAIVLLESLVAEYPTVPEYRHLLACCYREPSPGRPGGVSGTERAVDLLSKLVEEFPNVPDYRLDLCETLASKGPPDHHDGQTPAKVEARLEQAVRVSKKLAADYPTVPDYVAAYARCLDRLGMNLYDAGQFAEAEKNHRKAVALQRKLVQQYPDTVAFGLWLCLMERCLGRTVAARGELKEGRELLEGATSRVEAMWQKDRRLEGVRPFLGKAYRDLANVLEKSNEPALAAAALAKAKEFDGKGDKRR